MTQDIATHLRALADDYNDKPMPLGDWCTSAYRALREAAATIERYEAALEQWRSLYRRAINEANGLTNYVEDRPELRSAERRIEQIAQEARAALKGKTNE